MNNKPDETVLISYIYGELDEKGRQQVEQYLAENPSERERLKGLSDAHEIIGSLGDKEIITPPVWLEDTGGLRSILRSAFFKTTMSIAASFLLLMIAGKIIGMEIRYRSGELTINFGGTRSDSMQGGNQAAMGSQEVRSMINAALTKNNESIMAQWAEEQKKVDASIRDNFDQNARRLDIVMKSATALSQEQVRTFVAGLQSENLRLMKDYLKLSSTEQKTYVESLLVDFSKYLQEQRNQDLNAFQARMNSLEKNSDQFKQDTEQILSSLISTASVPRRKNSY